MRPVEIRYAVVQLAIVDIERRGSRRLRVACADGGITRIPGPCVQRLRERIGEVRRHALGESFCHPRFQRMIGRNIVRVENLDAAEVLREGMEGERVPDRETGHVSAALKPRAKRIGHRRHRILLQLRGVQPAQHLGSGFPGV